MAQKHLVDRMMTSLCTDRPWVRARVEAILDEAEAGGWRRGATVGGWTVALVCVLARVAWWLLR